MHRQDLIRRIHHHLESRGRPRVELFLIVALSGLAGFLASYSLLAAGIDSMATRYGLAGAAGYLAFLGLLAVWIAWKRRTALGPDLPEPLDLFDIASHARLQFPDPSVTAFDGGASGGAGASGSWEGAAGDSSSGSWFEADIDFGWIVIVVAVALAGLVAVGYVISIAPLLLAEVLVDAVVVAVVTRKVGELERRDWTATVVRRTWLPAAAMLLMLVVGGWLLQRIAPEARSIGPAIDTIIGRAR